MRNRSTVGLVAKGFIRNWNFLVQKRGNSSQQEVQQGHHRVEQDSSWPQI